MNAEILSVGTELLLGDILNSNSQFLSRELAAYGIDILYQSTVGDNAERLKSALELALSRCDMVIVTGGLGPTEDDLTRETVADYFRLPLVLHEESLQRIQEYFRNTGREYAENNQKQAMLPEGSVVFPNDYGTSPGCAVQRYGQTVILLPGPPREMIPMFVDHVVPFLSGLSGGTIHSHTVGVFGVPESVIDERLQDLIKGSNPTVAPYAKDGEVVLRITAKAENGAKADELCAPVIEQIRERLGTAVYGVDAGSLQKVVVSKLMEKELKIATAESCTAGMLSGRLTEVPGVSQVFECGVAAYSKEIKHQVLGVPETVLDQEGAVSPETAAAMAIGARKVGGADIGVGITGVAGPEPSEEKAVGTVYVALADDRRVWVRKIFAGHGGDERDHIRYVATSHALDMARRYLEALPGVMAGGQMVEALFPEGTAEPTPKAETVPQKKPVSRARKTLWIAALLTVLMIAGFITYAYVLTPYLNQKKFEELWVMYSQGDSGQPDDGNITYPEGILSRFMALYRVNNHVRGWVTIKDTKINYPVVQEPSKGFYEFHDFYKGSSLYGVPYLSADVQMGATVDNRSLVIYGNNPRNEQMFSNLTSYTNLGFLQQHPVIEMNTLFRSDMYKIFAVMIVGEAERYSDNFDYTVDTFADEEDFLYYVSEIRQRSLFNTPVAVQEGDDLLMLTTPIDYGFEGARIVVVARRVRIGESAENDLSYSRVNTTVKMPLAWQILQGDITAPVGGFTTATGTTVDQYITTTAPGSYGTSSSDTQETDPTEPDYSDEEPEENEEPDQLIEESTTTHITTTTTTAAPTTTTTTAAPTTTTTTVTTTTTTVSPTTTKPETTTATTTTTTTVTTTTTTTETTTTTTTVATTTTTTTTEQPPSEVPSQPLPSGVLAGTINESEFLTYFRVKNSNASTVKLPGQDSSGVIKPTTKEELQYAVTSIVIAEMGRSSSMVNSVEAQKAQAVATYTYILWYNKTYGKPYAAKCRAVNLSATRDKKIFDAVGEVVGVKVLDTSQTKIANMFCETTYSASSCGNTANSNCVWSGSNPICNSVPSPYDNLLMNAKYNGNSPFLETVTMSREDLYTKVKAWVKSNVQNRYPDYTMPEEQFIEGGGESPLQALSYDGDGTAGTGEAWNYVYKTNFYYQRTNGTKVNLTGYNLRGALGLKSHAFRVTYDAATDMVTITTQGWGHGVGLSQLGAIGYANEAGWDYVQILKHYFSITDTTPYQVIAPLW